VTTSGHPGPKTDAIEILGRCSGDKNDANSDALCCTVCAVLRLMRGVLGGERWMVGSQVPLPRPKRAENCPKFLWGGSRTHHALIPLLRPPHPLHNGTGALWDPDRTCSPGMYWVNWVRSCKPRRKLCDTLVGMRKPARSFSNEESHVQFLIVPMAPHLNPRVGYVFAWRAIAAVVGALPPGAPLARPCSRRFVVPAWSYGTPLPERPGRRSRHCRT
jgi:hypothetical protein